MSIGIIGLGYVGLPLGVAFAERGEDVVGLDIDQRKGEAIRGGDSHIEDISSERLRAVASRVTTTTRYEELATAEAVIICVPTPLGMCVDHLAVADRVPALVDLRGVTRGAAVPNVVRL